MGPEKGPRAQEMKREEKRPWGKVSGKKTALLPQNPRVCGPDYTELKRQVTSHFQTRPENLKLGPRPSLTYRTRWPSKI